MAGSSNNITTQWSFRDGRDYVLSLTTTETPNTVSFWISDKITGEEWTGCYDENGIENVTKRTGCFKSFPTFLSMIKSALLKKSDSVVLDLLNIEDLAAISLHRQNPVLQPGGGGIGGGTLSNFQLYNSETLGCSSSSSASRNVKPHTSDTANMITSTNNKSSLNKRKYLIITYVAEFDKVHYPLPLNYSSPPDLNVMQSNIMRLKAEVTSLRNAKLELETELDSIKSETHTTTTHENNKDVNYNSEKLTKMPVVDERLVQSDKTTAENQRDNEVEGIVVETSYRRSSGLPCPRCAGLVTSLQSKVVDLEDAFSAQRDVHMHAMEGLENENHFLRHKLAAQGTCVMVTHEQALCRWIVRLICHNSRMKGVVVEAAEKYELELWNQIQKLKEKVAKADLERNCEGRKDARRYRFHQSRHDLFFNYQNLSDAASQAQSKRKVLESPSRLNGNSNPAKKQFGGTSADVSRRGKDISIRPSRNLNDKKQVPRSRSDSTASYCSIDSTHSKDRRLQHGREPTDRVARSRSTSYQAVYRGLVKQERHRSSSPIKTFDPTAYVTEKKLKQSRIASLRMLKIESRIRSGSRSRPSMVSPKRSAHSTSPIRDMRQSNLALFDHKTPFRRDDLRGRIGDHDNDNQPNSFKDRLERKSYGVEAKKEVITGNNIRPSSAGSGATKVIQSRSRFTCDSVLPQNKKLLVPLMTMNIKNASASSRPKSPRFQTDLKHRILRSPAQTSLSIRKPRLRTPSPLRYS